MDDQPCTHLDLPDWIKEGLCRHFTTIGQVKAAIAEGSLEGHERKWGRDFVRQVKHAISDYAKANPDAPSENEKDRAT